MILNSEQQYQRMTQTPVPRLVTSLAIPTTASMLVTTIYNMGDTFFVSQIGTSAAAAVGIVFSLMSLMQAVGGGFGMGANSLISRLLGARQDEEANQYASSAFFSSILFGLLLMIFGLSALDPLMRFLGSTETMLPYARDYARYILIGAPIVCSSFVLNFVLKAQGDAIISMLGMSIGGIINLALDPLFIFVLDWGIAGAAIATVISQTIGFLILLSPFVLKKSIVRISPSCISRRPGDYLQLVKIGFPTICRQGLASLSSALLNIQASVYGDAAVAAVTISNRIYLFVRNLILGIGQGFQPVAGYNFGAGIHKRVKESFRFVVLVGTILCTVLAAALALNAAQVIAWFRADDPEVIRIGTTALYFACSVMPFMAFSTYVNQMYQSLGFSLQATLLASCRQGIFYVPLVFLLPALLKLTGVQMAQPCSDFCTFVISLPFLIYFYRKLLPRAAAKGVAAK